MLVSYIIPSFNHDKYIFDALNSIKTDIFCEHEIIILDDGSTDMSAQVVSQWIQQNNSLNIQFIQQTNQGVCYSINKLLGLSKGDFIRLVGSDDQIIPGSTEILIDALNHDDSKLVAFGDSQTIDSQGRLLSNSHIDFLKKNKDMYKKDLKKAIISEWAVVGPVLVYRKDFMSQVGPYDESILIEDWNMYLRLAGLEKIVFVDTPVAKYRVHEANTSRTRDVQKRIQNLSSQYTGGARSLKYFNGRHLNLLKSELYLTEAKIEFLKKNVIQLAIKLIKYGYSKLK